MTARLLAAFSFALALHAEDLRLSYHSMIDGAEQPYRVYVPEPASDRKSVV